MFRRFASLILLFALAAGLAGCRGSGSARPLGTAEPRTNVVPSQRDVVPPAIRQRDSAARRQRQLARYGLNDDHKTSPSSSKQLLGGDQSASGTATVLQAAHVISEPSLKPSRITQPPPPPSAPAIAGIRSQESGTRNQESGVRKTKDNPQSSILNLQFPETNDVPNLDGPTPVGGVQPIDLSTSLALVAGQNPQVGFVQQRVQEAYAQLESAEALWLPSLRAGANYNKHEGSFQDVAGEVFNVSRGSMFSGFGSRAVGASSPAVPGLSTQFHVADAIFQPLIARRTVSARQYAVSATTNNLLLQAAVAYIDLELAVERRRVAEETLAELQKLAELTASFAKRGQAPQADADRARTELELQKNRVTRAIEAVQKASSRLTEVLSLGHDMELRPSGPAFPRMELVDFSAELKSLIGQAVACRPEMSQSLMEISAASNRFKKERYSPLIPHVGAGMSWGGFGGGVGDTITHYRDRLDLDAWVFWEVRNLGIGERAARKAAGARVHQAQYQRARLSNRIRREVKDAYAELLSATKQIEQSEASLKAAIESYKKNDRRIRNAQGLPIEVLQSIRALDAAKRELVNARAAYNRAQFRLHHAIGWPAGDSHE